MTLRAVSADCRQRLVGHYGSGVLGWLMGVPALLDKAASRWDLSLVGYHDAGHSSVVATGIDNLGRPVLVKAWADRNRFRHEVQALRHWAGGPVVQVIGHADDLAVAVLDLVAERPGGGDRPGDETVKVAEALRALHLLGRHRPPEDMPLLVDYLRDEIAPRVRWRQERIDHSRWADVAHTGLVALDHLLDMEASWTLLHADLYRENILFSNEGHPLFIDPLPMVGDAAFDWAFWVVYYTVSHDIDHRMSIAARISDVSARDIRRWSELLFLDGLLYYLETDDPRVSLMGASAVAFLPNGEENGS